MHSAQHILLFFAFLTILLLVGFFAFRYRNELMPSNKDIKFTCADENILVGEDGTFYCKE